MIVTFIFGLLLGVIFTMLLCRTKSVGHLRIDESDTDGPYLFLELNKELSAIRRKKYITLKVKLKNYISHE